MMQNFVLTSKRNGVAEFLILSLMQYGRNFDFIRQISLRILWKALRSDSNPDSVTLAWMTVQNDQKVYWSGIGRNGQDIR